MDDLGNGYTIIGMIFLLMLSLPVVVLLSAIIYTLQEKLTIRKSYRKTMKFGGMLATVAVIVAVLLAFTTKENNFINGILTGLFSLEIVSLAATVVVFFVILFENRPRTRK